MTNNNRERVIKLQKGQTLYVVCPPYAPFRVFFDSKLNDLAVAECEPQDVPAIEENAPLVQGADRTATEVNADWEQTIKRGNEALDRIIEPAVDAEIEAAIKQGIITPTFPDRFNKPTEQLHVEAVEQTLGPVAQLYKHEKEVLGATVTAYTHDPASPYDRKTETENVQPAQPAKPQTDLFGNALDSDIPFFNEPTQ